MAFCTNCGASVTGAFCNQCGTPAGAARGPLTAASPAAGQPAAGVAAAPAMAPAPRKTSPLVWVLVIILGLFVLGFIGVVGAGYFLVHKARQAGFDPALMSRNPGLAVAKLVTAVNPDAEVIRTDDAAGAITVRDRTNGKVFTFSFDDVRNGRFNMRVEGEDGKTTAVEAGSANAKLPSWVPAYPGSAAQGTFSITGSSSDGSGEGGNFTFTTPDPPSKVMAFYQDKAKELGMTANLNTNTADGGMLIAAGEDNQRTLTVVVGKGSPDTTVNLTYTVKK